MLKCLVTTLGTSDSLLTENSQDKKPTLQTLNLKSTPTGEKLSEAG